jgi:ABC-type multidrug transport system permease subunit
MANLIAIKANTKLINNNIKSAKTNIDGIDLEVIKVESKVDNKLNDYTNTLNDIIVKGKKVCDDAISLSKSSNISNENFYVDKFTEHKNNIIDLENTSDAQFSNFKKEFEKIKDGLSDLNNKLNSANKKRKITSEKIRNIIERLEDSTKKLDTLKSSMEDVNKIVGGLKVTNSENIVNPVKTKIKPIVANSNNLSYLFSYLFMLVIMLVSLMLSGTLVILDKKSKAFFRNHLTPTININHIISHFITNTLIILTQVIIISIIAEYFLKVPIFENILTILIIVFISIIFFTSIGMMVGYLLNSQESINITNLGIGALFLILSNLIFPLERLPESFNFITTYNPYVVVSELLKKVILFNIKLNIIKLDVLLFFITSIAVFMIMILIEKASEYLYFNKFGLRSKRNKYKAKGENIPFKLNNGKMIFDELELLSEIKIMDKKTFDSYIKEEKNEFYNWINSDLQNKKYANQIKKIKSREEFISISEKYLSMEDEKNN